MGEYKFKVEVSDQKDNYLMEAYFSANRAPDEPGVDLTREEILAYLQQFQITYGIQPDAIDKILEQGYAQNELIARGDQPEPGEDARFDILVPEEVFAYETFASPDILTLDDFEFPDYVIPTVAAGTPLIRKFPPTAGQPGKNVFGQPTGPAPLGKDKNLPKARNADIAPDDKNLLVATVAGYPFITAHCVAVEPVHLIERDIGRTMASQDDKDAVPTVNFDGIVMIRGSIKDQVRLVATSDVIILGATEAVVVESGRNVIISGGVTGKDMAVIKSQGDIISRFVEMCTLESGGDIYAQNIIQSFVIALGRVYAERIVGGEVRGTGLVAAHVIGSEGVDTAIMGGINPYLEEKLEKTREEILGRRSELKERMAAIARLVFTEKRGNDDAELVALRAQIPAIELAIQQLYDRETRLAGYQSETGNASVIAYETIYAGSMVLFNEDFEHFVEETDSKVSFTVGRYGITRKGLEETSEEEVIEAEAVEVTEG